MESIRGTKGANLLDTIDQLRKLNIDDEISLPQIVVVGQQSAGKSSVLQAISGIKFPTNEGLGTRFPTEVIMRRDIQESASIQIVQNTAGKDADLDKRIESFRDQQKNIDETQSPLVRLPELIEEASNALEEHPSKGLRSESLRIEITGPKQDHLTLVDLPGLFQTAKRGQNETDPQLIKNLVLKYMQKPRSIILAVVTATTDFANQEILEILKTVDPTGARTMGVITGVDRVTSGTPRERDFMALARNEEIPLELGWHVLRNLDQKERADPSLDRDLVEADFFNVKEPWKDLPAANRGARELKTQLSHILMNHIGRELGNVVIAIDKAMEEQQNILNKLGPERTTVFDQRVFLAELGNKHQSLVRAALEGQYNSEFFSKTGERLRGKIQATMKDFAKMMKTEGHRWEILTPHPTVFGVLTAYDVPNASIGEASPQDRSFTKPVKINKVNYLHKVRKLLRDHAGRELEGGYDPLLVGTLFKDQACYWEEIARSHVSKVVTDVTMFIEDVTMHLADIKRGDVLLTKRLDAAISERQTRVNVKITELLKPYDKFHPITYNEDYSRMLHEVPSMRNSDSEPTKIEFDLVSCQHLLECMQAYYTIALARFVDNVATLGIEMCLLDGLDELLSPFTVAKMSDEEIGDLAGEFPEDAHRRRVAQSKLTKLSNGRQLCQKHAVAGSISHGSLTLDVASEAISQNNSRSTTASSIPQVIAAPTEPSLLFAAATPLHGTARNGISTPVSVNTTDRKEAKSSLSGAKPNLPNGASVNSDPNPENATAPSTFCFGGQASNKVNANFSTQQDSQFSGPPSGTTFRTQGSSSLFGQNLNSTFNAKNESASRPAPFNFTITPSSNVKHSENSSSGSLFVRTPSSSGFGVASNSNGSGGSSSSSGFGGSAKSPDR